LEEQGMSADDTLKAWIQVLLVGAVLAAYVWVYGDELARVWRKQSPAANDFKTYAFTIFGAVIGGVCAFYLGVKLSAGDSLIPVAPPGAGTLRGIYSAVYIFANLAGMFVWAKRADFASPLLKNSVTTFGGLAVAVVTNLLAPDG
jgi:hypothetical protein